MARFPKIPLKSIISQPTPAPVMLQTQVPNMAIPAILPTRCGVSAWSIRDVTVRYTSPFKISKADAPYCPAIFPIPPDISTPILHASKSKETHMPVYVLLCSWALWPSSGGCWEFSASYCATRSRALAWIVSSTQISQPLPDLTMEYGRPHEASTNP